MTDPSPVMNARALASTDRTVPPLMYVSPELGEPARPALMRLVERAGLIPLRIEGDSFRLVAAPGLTMAIDPGREVEISLMDGASLVYGITITDPPTWCDIALGLGHALVLVGPCLAWTYEEMNLRRALDMAADAGAYVGAVAVYPRP